MQAIGRILQIEYERMQEALWGGNNSMYPPAVYDRFCEHAETRGPIVTWALDLWIKGQIGTDEFGVWCPTLKRLELHPWQRFKAPSIVTSLRALELELASQVKFGLRVAPLRVFKLAYSAFLVTLFALLQRFPGFAALNPLRNLLQKTWPRTLDCLAATLEKNFAFDRTRIGVSDRAKRIGAKWRSKFPLAEWGARLPAQWSSRIPMFMRPMFR